MPELMKDQIWASPQRGLPVQSEVGASAITITGEVVQLYYSNSGVRTVDADQVAGVAVEGKLAYSKVLNAAGSMLGTKNDSSLSFTSTAFTSQVTFESLGITRQQLEATDSMTFAKRLSTLTSGMTNGQYAVDHRTGTVYGVKADNSTSLTAVTYKVLTGVTSINPSQLGLIGGGGAGGGNNTYSTEQGDFTATVTNGTTNIVLSVDSVGGAAITAANFANGVLKVWDASTEQMVKITLDDFTWTAATKTLAVANCTGAFTFATADVVSLTLIGPDKSLDKLTDSTKTTLTRDETDQFVGETLAALTNIATNTTGYLYFTMDGYRYFTLQCETSGATPTDTLTLTVEATCQDDGTVPASCTYQDVTNAWFGAASYVDTTVMLAKTTPTAVKYVRLKYVTSNGGGDDADLTAYLRRLY